MQLIHVCNVQQALPEGCRLMLAHGLERESRNGPCKQLPFVLVTVYEKPFERVLFWPQRDANPFFHFAESLWMLAGRQDVSFVERFNSNISSYSDDGVVFNAAYGYRWRRHFGFDQITVIVKNLQKDPWCRRQVLQIWDPADLNKMSSKDLACNTCVYFQRSLDDKLDMMVTNRSNDLIWGVYGANAVHFSVLQEYVASQLGWPVGKYTHVSMNTHLYERHYALAEELAEQAPKLPWGRHSYRDPYYMSGDEKIYPYPIRWQPTSVEEWDHELRMLLIGKLEAHFQDPFFRNIALPMFKAWNTFKQLKDAPDRIEQAVAVLRQMPPSNDWKKAGIEWLQRRNK